MRRDLESRLEHLEGASDKGLPDAFWQAVEIDFLGCIDVTDGDWEEIWRHRDVSVYRNRRTGVLLGEESRPLSELTPGHCQRK